MYSDVTFPVPRCAHRMIADSDEENDDDAADESPAPKVTSVGSVEETRSLTRRLFLSKAHCVE